MPITKRQIGTNEDGTPHWDYLLEGDGHFLVTGPAAGLVRTADGTEYYVDDDVIEVASVEHAEEVSHQIGLQHMRRGTFDRDRTDGAKWVHEHDPEVAERFTKEQP